MVAGFGASQRSSGESTLANTVDAKQLAAEIFSEAWNEAAARGIIRTALVIDRYREPSGEPPGQGAPAQARAVGEE